MITQPEALRLADWLDAHANGPMAVQHQAAAKLRRLHAENERLRDACAKEFESVQELDNRRTADEALLRQALEALIAASGNVRNDVFVKVMLARDAVSCALRAALAEAALQRLNDVQQEIEAVLAEPHVDDINVVDMAEQPAEQEPAPGYCKHCKQYTIEEPLPAESVAVAYMLPRDGDDCAIFREPSSFATRYSPKGWTPLYTAPQPTKQPLTDDEIRRMWEPHYSDPWADYKDFARAIEAAHGITGEAK